MDPSVEFRPATAADAPAVRTLLAAAGLPADDADPSRQEFLLAVRGGAVVGTAGLEIRRRDALLRSVAVAPELRGRGVAGALVDRVLDHARASGVETVWALTLTADEWLSRRGFARVERTSAPPAIAATSEFRGCCPATARCYRRRLGE